MNNAIWKDHMHGWRTHVKWNTPSDCCLNEEKNQVFLPSSCIQKQIQAKMYHKILIDLKKMEVKWKFNCHNTDLTQQQINHLNSRISTFWKDQPFRRHAYRHTEQKSPSFSGTLLRREIFLQTMQLSDWSNSRLEGSACSSDDTRVVLSKDEALLSGDKDCLITSEDTVNSPWLGNADLQSSWSAEPVGEWKGSLVDKLCACTARHVWSNVILCKMVHVRNTRPSQI